MPKTRTKLSELAERCGLQIEHANLRTGGTLGNWPLRFVAKSGCRTLFMVNPEHLFDAGGNWFEDDLQPPPETGR